jgi:hypothetical protein
MEPIYWNGLEGKGKKDGDNKQNSAKGLVVDKLLPSSFKTPNLELRI